MKKLIFLLLLALLLLLLTPYPAAADRSPAPLKSVTVWTVTNLLDTGAEPCTASDCSLRSAITAANADGADSAIYFKSELTGGTISLNSPLPPITGPNLTVISVFSAGGITISGANLNQILTIDSGANVGLRYLTFLDAYSTTPGGAISNAGTLTIQYCLFQTNHSTGEGGAIYNATPGVVDMDVAVFNGNKGSRGGAISNASSVDNTGAGTMNIHHSWFHGNEATAEGGAIYNTGGPFVHLHVYQSFFGFNASGTNGGGIFQGSGYTLVENSTFSGNRALNGAALSNGTGWTLSVRNSTISGNRASAGGSIHNGSGILDLRNTIAANQLEGTNCSGVISNGGNNIDNGASCGWSSVDGSLSNTDPHLGPLGNASTMMPLWKSPAIDGVIHEPLDCPAVDQRGVSRPRDGDHDGTALCDIGAHELEIDFKLIFIPLSIR